MLIERSPGDGKLKTVSPEKVRQANDALAEQAKKQTRAKITRRNPASRTGK